MLHHLVFAATVWFSLWLLDSVELGIQGWRSDRASWDWCLCARRCLKCYGSTGTAFHSLPCPASRRPCMWRHLTWEIELHFCLAELSPTRR